MTRKTMEVYHEVFLSEGRKKVIVFSIVPEKGKELLAVRKLNYAVMKHYIDTGVLYNLFKEVQNPYVQLLVEGLENYKPVI
jgi:hypothetical protein